MAGSTPRWVLVPLLLMVAFGLSGCVQDSVSNQVDAFSYGGQVADRSGGHTYTWHVTGSSVQVNWGGQAAKGSLDLVLKDGAGNQVYTRSFSGASQGGSSETLRNVKAGDWSVSIQFHGFTGQMGLSLTASGAGAGGNYCPQGVPGC
ncbi:MAG TPA: hypothetical protein VM286_02115 [Candidatus Thermoplasmatota archaeon]|nr:hypothetical protein [Candidatus Thermoplasmatota archaeon]